ncbi:hypothetical protein AVEN_15870-1 [Araneus ventricosus]|uniref:Uncharacterized protein n=1 Tax=Araneus ventricosus TaxID=182803 RepID=A0A4Y2VWQ0_ARAVE|nr:hypothetical protein AVEN_15870-1 [Araneus ventricosus]
MLVAPVKCPLFSVTFKTSQKFGQKLALMTYTMETPGYGFHGNGSVNQNNRAPVRLSGHWRLSLSVRMDPKKRVTRNLVPDKCLEPRLGAKSGLMGGVAPDFPLELLQQFIDTIEL